MFFFRFLKFLKNKKNYTVSAPRHQEKVTQHAASAKMHSKQA